MPVSAGEHRAIVKAIASGDAAAAGQAMYEHVMDSKERTIRNNLAQRGDAQAAAPALVMAAAAAAAPKAVKPRKTAKPARSGSN
jgi:hypothetical protein